MDDGIKKLFHEVLPVEIHRISFLSGRIEMPVEYLESLIFDFQIDYVLEKRLCHGRNRIFLLRRQIGADRDGRIEFLHFLLHLVYIEVTDYYHSLKVRTVPFLVEVQDFMPLESVDDFIFSYDIPFGIFRSLVDQIHLSCRYP